MIVTALRWRMAMIRTIMTGLLIFNYCYFLYFQIVIFPLFYCAWKTAIDTYKTKNEILIISSNQEMLIYVKFLFPHLKVDC